MAADANGYLQDNDDSDADSDVDHYHPISAESDGGGDHEITDDAPLSRSGDHDAIYCHQNGTPNPYLLHSVENGISELDLNGNGGDFGSSDEEEAAEEEMEREREASISRAFREDESRRSAPLTPENAARVMEAMRGVAFPGTVPAWAGEVPEERWLDQLSRLRGELSP